MTTCDPLVRGARQLNPSTLFGTSGNSGFQIVWEDGERVFYGGISPANADRSVLAVLPATEHPAPATLDRLAHGKAKRSSAAMPQPLPIGCGKSVRTTNSRC
jgi:hypothetical protein